jgi:hypothetical protein
MEQNFFKEKELFEKQQEKRKIRDAYDNKMAERKAKKKKRVENVSRDKND